MITSPTPRYRVNAPNVVGEDFEGEVVAVNLVSGTYYSLEGCAGVAWQHLVTGTTSQRLAAVFAAHYDCTGVALEAEVADLLTRLVDLQLVVAGAAVTETGDPHAPTAEPVVDLRARPRFEPARIEEFGDLQDVLLLDPIHDVDEAGWPVAASPRSPAPARDPWVPDIDRSPHDRSGGGRSARDRSGGGRSARDRSGGGRERGE